MNGILNYSTAPSPGLKAWATSLNGYVEEALELYLTDYADAQIAKERFNSPGTTMISGKELRKRLGV